MSDVYEQLPPTVESLVAILKKLRSPEGCPWDREQTAASLARCLVGEVAELVDAIDAADAENIAEEIGDVLMNLVFQAVVAEEQGLFDWETAVRRINAKMLRRHPHVFGEEVAHNTDDVLKLWKRVKTGEGKIGGATDSILARIPHSLSALTTAEEMQRKASKVGFDWSTQAGILDKIAEELHEVRAALATGDEEQVDEEIGDLLFAVTNLSRFRKRRSAEELLRAANGKFKRRFAYIEQELRTAGIPLEGAGIERMEQLWQEAKRHE